MQRRPSLHKQADWGMWDRLKLAPVLFYEILKLTQMPFLFISHQCKHQLNCHWESPLLNLKTPQTWSKHQAGLQVPVTSHLPTHHQSIPSPHPEFKLLNRSEITSTFHPILSHPATKNISML